MRVPRVFQHAGREQALDVGQVYDLPELVAVSLVATGAAERARVLSAPERAVAGVPEHAGEDQALAAGGAPKRMRRHA